MVWILLNVLDLGQELSAPGVSEGLSPKQDGPGISPTESEDEPEEGSLTAAAWAHQGHEVALRQAQIDVVQDASFFARPRKRLGHILQNEELVAVAGRSGRE